MTWAFKQRAVVQVVMDVVPAILSLPSILSTTQSRSLSLVLPSRVCLTKNPSFEIYNMLFKNTSQNTDSSGVGRKNGRAVVITAFKTHATDL